MNTSTSTNYEIDPAFSPYKKPNIPSARAKAPAKRRRTTFVYSSKRKVKCHICGVLCKSRSTFNNHLKYLHGDFVFECIFCHKFFSRPSNVLAHVTNHHPGQPSGANSNELYRVVAKNDVSPQVLAVMRKMSNIASMSRRSKKTPPKPNLVLPTITAFNCFDCSESFRTISDLFGHCQIHRISETGSKYPYLVPVTKNPKLM